MPDVGGLIPLADLAFGPDPTAHPGASSGLALLAPIDECEIIETEPPVTPDLCIEGARQVPPTRRVRLACGHLRTSSLETRGRATWQLSWTGVDASELALLRDYFVNDVGGRLRGFPCRVDGPDEDAVIVRLTEPFSYESADLGVFVISLGAEEVIAAA